MPFTPEDISRLELLCAGSDGGVQALAEYRRQFPGRSLTRCDVSDMGAEQPFRHFAAVDLYLVDGREHCWSLTTDPALATGVVLALRTRSA